MRKKTPLYLAVFFLLMFGNIVYAQTAADQHEQLIREQEELKKEKEKIVADTKSQIDQILLGKGTVDQKIRQVNSKISEIDVTLSSTKSQINEKEATLVARQKELDEKSTQLSKVSIDMYKDLRVGYLEILLSSNDFERSIKMFNYRKFILQAQTEEFNSIYGTYSLILDQTKALQRDKELLDTQRKAFEDAKIALEAEKARIQQEINEKNAYASKLNSEIAGLSKSISKLQQELIILKSGGTYVDVNTIPSVSVDKNSTLAGFLNNAPSGSFAVFSFSAYTHRNGVSQYGAKARAAAGQNHLQILKFYFPNGAINTTYPVMEKIRVEGYGEIDFETTYLYGISEMPTSWDMEALKTQAIIARTYAIRRTANGAGTICTTESCQVYRPRDPNTVPNWKRAVDETRGMVLLDGSGNVISTQYASLHGGYVNNVGWDTTDGTNQGDWPGRSWDAKAPHPWFYRSWYRKGYSDSGDTCGHPAWLTEEEMADIINAYLLLKGTDLKAPVDTSRIAGVNTVSCWGKNVNPYSMQEIRDLINTPVTQIYGKPIVSQGNNGVTTTVIFSTNRGSITMSGSDFKNAYNLRAPGAMRIPQSGFSFFNIERKI